MAHFRIQVKHVNGGGWQDAGYGLLNQATMLQYWGGYSYSTDLRDYRVMKYTKSREPEVYLTSKPTKDKT